MDYWAPELWRKKPAKFKSDMYSLGLILYFMMAKTLPDFDEVEIGIFKLPWHYSKELYDICAKLI